MDIKSAFHLLPVHPADRHLLAMNWNTHVFIDTCLPFRLRSAPKLFNVLADFLSWILEQKDVCPLLHYLDYFLLVAPPKSSTCSNNLLKVWVSPWLGKRLKDLRWQLDTCTRLRVHDCLGGNAGTCNIICGHPHRSRSQ